MPKGVYKHRKGYKRKPFSEEWKEKIRQARAKQIFTPEQIEKRVAKLRGIKRPARTTEWSNKISLANTGRIQTLEERVKRSLAQKRVVAEGRHNFFKHGQSMGNKTKRNREMMTPEYRFWRDSVFRRDKFTCTECGLKSGSGKAVVLNADHIKAYYLYPELRLDVSNGRTLCVDCHRKTDSYAGRIIILGIKK